MRKSLPKGDVRTGPVNGTFKELTPTFQIPALANKVARAGSKQCQLLRSAKTLGAGAYVAEPLERE